MTEIIFQVISGPKNYLSAWLTYVGEKRRQSLDPEGVKKYFIIHLEQTLSMCLSSIKR